MTAILLSSFINQKTDRVSYKVVASPFDRPSDEEIERMFKSLSPEAPLYSEADGRHVGVVQEIWAQMAEAQGGTLTVEQINQPERYGETLLQRAAYGGHVDLAQAIKT